MSLLEPIPTPCGCALAPVDLSAAKEQTARLEQQSRAPPQPQYAGDGYRPNAWKRTSFIVPAASPRSTYSKPLAGGESRDELPADQYEQLAKNPKLVEQTPFFSDQNVPPQQVPFLVGANGSGSNPSWMPSLVVERLIPRRSSRKTPGKIIVAAHGLGFCKENFLPLLDRLIDNDDHDIEQVWLIDALGHGMTSIYNETLTSPDILSAQHRVVDSNDYARDLILFLTCYLPSALNSTTQDSAALPYSPPQLPPRKIVGLGHSFGATALLQVAAHLPDLFESLAVMEPILVRQALVHNAAKIPLARFTLMKKDLWPTRQAAQADAAADRMTASWDARVRDTLIAGSLCDHPNGKEVTRCCDRVAEALCIRGNRPGIQLATYSMQHLPANIKVLYISCHKPLLLPVEEVRSTAEQIAGVDFHTIKGTHSLPQEQPDAIADLIKTNLFRNSLTSRL